MASRAAKSLTVDLGPLTAAVERRVESGRYTSANAVLKASLEALDREEQDFDELVREMVAEALADPSPPIPHAQVVTDLEAHIAKRRAASAKPVE